MFTGEGYIFYKQERVGQNGEPFNLLLSPSTHSVSLTGNGNEIEGIFSWTPDITHLSPIPYMVVFRTTDFFFYYDETVQVEVSLTSDINEQSSFELMDIYPNPANNTLNISSDKKIKKIEIYDALGRVIYTESNPSAAINVEQLEAGLYSIAIIFDDNRIVKKFIK